MKIQKQPDYLIFADSAKKGENAAFPDVSRGWGVTIDQTASKPPMEWMNGAFNRIDKNMLYLLQQGVPEWSELVTYPVNAIIKYNGVLYTSIVENDNAKPSTNTTKWKKTQAEILSASTTQKGIVQLSSAIDSDSQTEAATPLAVNNAYNRANVANANAISANSNANNAHKNIENLGGRIANVEDKFTSGGTESRVYSYDKRFYFLVRNDGVAGFYDTVENKLLWSFRDDYFEIGKIPLNRIDGLNNYILSMYNQSFNANGFSKLPNGMVIQWGLANFQAKDGANGTMQSFYTEFPNACCVMLCSDGGIGVHITSAGPVNKRQFRCWSKESTPKNGVIYTDTAMFYIAIGF